MYHTLAKLYQYCFPNTFLKTEIIDSHVAQKPGSFYIRTRYQCSTNGTREINHVGCVEPWFLMSAQNKRSVTSAGHKALAERTHPWIIWACECRIIWETAWISILQPIHIQHTHRIVCVDVWRTVSLSSLRFFPNKHRTFQHSNIFRIK